MSYKFKVGDIVTLIPEYKSVSSFYSPNHDLAAWSDLEYKVGKKLVIERIHVDYPILYKIHLMWYHENWLEYYYEVEKFELGEELFKI
jgi:hypothetical protein